MGRRGELAAGLDEALRGLGEIEFEQGRAGGEHEVEAGGHELLVPAVDLAEAALGAGALHGVADGGPGGDHAHAGGGGGVRFGPGAPDEQERAAIGAAAVLAGGAEVAVALHALRGAKALRR